MGVGKISIFSSLNTTSSFTHCFVFKTKYQHIKGKKETFFILPSPTVTTSTVRCVTLYVFLHVAQLVYACLHNFLFTLWDHSACSTLLFFFFFKPQIHMRSISCHFLGFFRLKLLHGILQYG